MPWRGVYTSYAGGKLRGTHCQPRCRSIHPTCTRQSICGETFPASSPLGHLSPPSSLAIPLQYGTSQPRKRVESPSYPWRSDSPRRRPSPSMAMDLRLFWCSYSRCFTFWTYTRTSTLIRIRHIDTRHVQLVHGIERLARCDDACFV